MGNDTYADLNARPKIVVDLIIRRFFEDETAVVSPILVQPGDLTRSLCSPWQQDYRECACFYWAASRPDYVNVEPDAHGGSRGNNWLDKDRTSPKRYLAEGRAEFTDPRMVMYEELFVEWEKLLRFVIKGQEEDLEEPEN